MRKWLHPAVVAAAGVLAVLAATGITLGVTASGGGTGGGSTSGGGSGAAGGGALCEGLVVPAYFSPPYWETAIRSKPPPADMILDISGVGAGTAPVPQLQSLVKRARAGGITILGYSSTVDGERPAAQVEADVRHYAAWYGVRSIFLDRVASTPRQLPYYKRLAGYIHRAHHGARVWLNPGVYPDQRYMSVGDVVLTFEGSYAQYLTARVPSWARHYPATRFLHTIYATPGQVLVRTLKLARQRHAGRVYVTDLVGSNPYQGLPSYWAAEDADATAGCTRAG